MRTITLLAVLFATLFTLSPETRANDDDFLDQLNTGVRVLSKGVDTMDDHAWNNQRIANEQVRNHEIQANGQVDRQVYVLQSEAQAQIDFARAEQERAKVQLINVKARLGNANAAIVEYHNEVLRQRSLLEAQRLEIQRLREENAYLRQQVE